MTPESTPEEQLAEANRHIAEAEQRLAHQRAIIEQLATNGHDTTEAEYWVVVLEEGLQAMCYHRQLIVFELANKTP